MLNEIFYFNGVRVLGPKLFFVTGLVIFATAVARLVCPDLLGKCLSRSANIYFGPGTFGKSRVAPEKITSKP